MHHLNEHTRRTYLRAMGINQWYSRNVIPGARQLEWSLEDEALEQTAPSKKATAPSAAELMPSQNAGLSAVEPESSRMSGGELSADSHPNQEYDGSLESQDKVSQKLIAGDSADTAGVKHEGETPSVSGETSVVGTRSTNVEFIQRWWARNGWCLVDTRASNMPPEQQKASDRLMVALAQTLSGEREPAVSHRIDWPLFVNRSIRHDMTEARFYLSQKWDALQQECPSTHLLLLGELSPELLADPLKSNPEIKVLNGPGTSELMHLPGRKRQFWRTIQQWMRQ